MLMKLGEHLEGRREHPESREGALKGREGASREQGGSMLQQGYLCMLNNVRGAEKPDICLMSTCPEWASCLHPGEEGRAFYACGICMHQGSGSLMGKVGLFPLGRAQIPGRGLGSRGYHPPQGRRGRGGEDLKTVGTPKVTGTSFVFHA